MKRLLSIVILSLFFFSSCKKNQDSPQTSTTVKVQMAISGVYRGDYSVIIKSNTSQQTLLSVGPATKNMSYDFDATIGEEVKVSLSCLGPCSADFKLSGKGIGQVYSLDDSNTRQNLSTTFIIK